MEKATYPRVYGPALRPSDTPISPLISVVNGYPDNPIVKYLVAPFVNHLFKTILALLIFLFGSLIVCGRWNSEEVCDRRFHYTALSLAVGITGLMGYSYYLRQKLEKQQRLSGKA